MPISQIDKQLHLERALRGGGKVTFQAELKAVPTGSFIEFNGAALLLWLGRLYLWSHHGYGRTSLVLSPSELVTVLTPASIFKLLQHGFEPQVHESARS